MDDVRAVMDAADSERAALLRLSKDVPMSILFAATYPDRVQSLVCCGGMARSTEAEDGCSEQRKLTGFSGPAGPGRRRRS